MQRILVIGNNTLIGAGIENLLRRKRLFDVYGIAAESTSSLLLTIKQVQPHVIVIDQHAVTVSVDWLWLMLSAQHNDLNLIEVSAYTPYIRVFSKKQIWLTQSTTWTNTIDWLTNRNKCEIIFWKEAARL